MRSKQHFYFKKSTKLILSVIDVYTMAGLVKAKKYDWKDSNLALFGSDTERQVCVYIKTTYKVSNQDVTLGKKELR